MQVLAPLGLGLVLGLRHALDPDHVVAVTAITARVRRVLPATLLGIAWGVGHSITLFVVAGAILFFRWTVPPRLGLAMEFGVALALVILGLLNLKHPHHERSALERGSGRPPARRAFLVGIVHGLAGSAAVALLVLTMIGDTLLACGYLLLFGLGTLVGMTLITTGLALPMATAVRRWGRVGPLLRVSTGALSLALGVWLVYQLGWRAGLFLATPVWTPR